jgi:hypothetical protein
MGQSSRSEDIALARSQGLDVDDDNKPAPENIPAEGAVVDSTANIHEETIPRAENRKGLSLLQRVFTPCCIE